MHSNKQDSSQRYIYWLIGAFPLFFSTIKGWSNGVCFLIFIFSLFSIIRNKNYFLSQRNKNFWFLIAILALPFFTEVFAQIGRGNIIWRSLDGPSRFLIATSVFIFVTRCNICEKLPTQLSRGIYVSLLLLLAYVFLIDDYYWGHRLATQVLDPNTAAIYAVVFLSVSLLAIETLKDRPLIYFSAYLIGFGVTTYVCYYSQTRTAWVAQIILLLLILIRTFWSRKLALTGSIFVLLTIVLLAYQNVGGINARVNQAKDDLVQLYQGNPNTSLGTRITLNLVDLELLKLAPLFGFEDANPPSYQILKNQIPILTEEVYSTKSQAGSHSEAFAQLTRKGIFLGAITLFCVFAYPLYFFWRRRYSTLCSVRQIAQAGLMTTLILITVSLAFEVLNLKMTSTFWGIFLAVFLGSIHSLESANRETIDAT